MLNIFKIHSSICFYLILPLYLEFIQSILSKKYMLIIFEIELLNKCSIYWNLNSEYIQ